MALMARLTTKEFGYDDECLDAMGFDDHLTDGNGS